jgi:hypothetical protein
MGNSGEVQFAALGTGLGEGSRKGQSHGYSFETGILGLLSGMRLYNHRMVEIMIIE